MAKAKEIEGLDCVAEARAGIKLVLETRLGEMLEQRETALGVEGLNSVEGVHDMRVASRRLRSLIRDFTPYLNMKKFGDASDALKKLADVLGRVRDNDVAIIELEKLCAEAPEDVRAGIEYFTRKRHAVRDEARIKLERALDAERIEELRASFAPALEQALKGARRENKERKDGDSGAPSFETVGREIIERLWLELRERCASIHRPFRVERLHKARIAAKRLRYALELFAQCRGEHLKELAADVAKMQKALGDLHDCDEWIEGLGDWLTENGERKRVKSQADVEKESAAVWLFDHFVHERTRHYHDALMRWHDWETVDFDARLRRAIGLSADVDETTGL